jgi:hypothetical protein
MGPAIGQTVLQFNQLASDTATKFGAITGQIETQALSGQEQLLGMSGQAYAQAKTAVGQITGQLLQVRANSDAAYANSQSQLLATRTQAEMAGNDIQKELLPMTGTPYLDLTAAAVDSYNINSSLVHDDIQLKLQDWNFQNVVIPMVQAMQGSPIQNILNGALGMATQFGMGSGAGLMGAVAGAFGAGQPGV